MGGNMQEVATSYNKQIIPVWKVKWFKQLEKQLWALINKLF